MKGDSYVRCTSPSAAPQSRALQETGKGPSQILQVGRRCRSARLGNEVDRVRQKLHDLDVSLPRHGHRAYTPAELGQRIDRTIDRLTKHLNAADPSSRGPCTLARAQLALAREHGFASWPKFVGHLEGLARNNSPFSKFEAAVEAIVNGDISTLEKLLRENPALVRARSTREHRSTLLHYVSANGIEDFRQKRPPTSSRSRSCSSKPGSRQTPNPKHTAAVPPPGLSQPASIRNGRAYKSSYLRLMRYGCPDRPPRPATAIPRSEAALPTDAEKQGDSSPAECK